MAQRQWMVELATGRDRSGLSTIVGNRCQNLEIPPMLLATLTLAMAAVGQGPSDWFEPFPAHKVVGNVYYVGSKDLATFLITTPEGHILINSGFERTVPLIQKSV